MGLIQAAQKYPPDCPVPFAAYALARIRRAMSQAAERARTDRIGRGTRRHAPQRSKSGQSRHHPATSNRSEHRGPTQEDVARHNPTDNTPIETLGDRIRERYDQAVHRAVSRVAKNPDRLGDVTHLAQSIAHQRLMQPEEFWRTPLRDLADETCSSYARVVTCEEKLTAAARGELEHDLMFQVLREAARHNPEGVNTPIEPELERSMIEAVRVKFRSLYRTASPRLRAEWMLTLAGQLHGGEDSLLTALFDQLDEHGQAALIGKL